MSPQCEDPCMNRQVERGKLGPSKGGREWAEAWKASCAGKGLGEEEWLSGLWGSPEESPLRACRRESRKRPRDWGSRAQESQQEEKARGWEPLREQVVKQV